LAIRINHNLASAHNWTLDYLAGDTSHDHQTITSVYDRLDVYVTVALAGGEVEGITVSRLGSPPLREKMEEIGHLIGQMRTMTFDNLDQVADGPTTTEFESRFDALYIETKDNSR